MWNKKWDLRYLHLAKVFSTWSKDPSTKVGAVIAKGKLLVSSGYNGFPQGVLDDPETLENRQQKYKRVIHAEVNAILFAKKRKNCTLYTYPLLPCSCCASIIIQSGITSVVSIDNIPERWKESIDVSLELFREAKVQVRVYREDELPM